MGQTKAPPQVMPALLGFPHTRPGFPCQSKHIFLRMGSFAFGPSVVAKRFIPRRSRLFMSRLHYLLWLPAPCGILQAPWGLHKLFVVFWWCVAVAPRYSSREAKKNVHYPLGNPYYLATAAGTSSWHQQLAAAPTGSNSCHQQLAAAAGSSSNSMQ